MKASLKSAKVETSPITSEEQERWSDWMGMELFNDPVLIKTLGRCIQFVRNVRAAETQPHWLTLLGTTGTGKTHLARGVWRALKARSPLDWSQCDYQAREIYWPAFVDELRDKESNAQQQLRDFQTWPLLFLDDIGAESDKSGFASEKLNTLLARREGLWTIITSNLSLKQLGGIDPRIADRIIRRPNVLSNLETISYSLRKKP